MQANEKDRGEANKLREMENIVRGGSGRKQGQNSSLSTSFEVQQATARPIVSCANEYYRFQRSIFRRTFRTQVLPCVIFSLQFPVTHTLLLGLYLRSFLFRKRFSNACAHRTHWVLSLSLRIPPGIPFNSRQWPSGFRDIPRAF